MKKFVCTGLVTVMLLFLFVGCNQENEQIVGNSKTKGNVAGIYYSTSHEVIVLQDDGSARFSLSAFTDITDPEAKKLYTWTLEDDIVVITPTEDDWTRYAYLVDDGLIYNNNFYKKMK